MFFRKLSILRTSYLYSVLILCLACNTPLAHNKTHRDKSQRIIEGATGTVSKDDALILHLNLQPGSKYYYTINNTTEMELEVQGKSISNKNESEVGLSYEFEKDSTGNVLLHMRYDKIHIHVKNGDKETELDAANASTALDPTEKMLGLLKETNIIATINKAGKIVAISGYKELGQKILSGLNTDATTRSAVESQWEKVVGEGLIKKNVEQLFSIYPDSSVHIGDTWQKKMQQKGEINMNVASTFKLKDIDDDIAFIESEGDLASDKSESNLMGYSVTSNLQGDQQGEYEIDTKTGMLLKNKVTAKVEGSIQIMGKDVPVTIKTTVKMNGKKVR